MFFPLARVSGGGGRSHHSSEHQTENGPEWKIWKLGFSESERDLRIYDRHILVTYCGGRGSNCSVVLLSEVRSRYMRTSIIFQSAGDALNSTRCVLSKAPRRFERVHRGGSAPRRPTGPGESYRSLRRLARQLQSKQVVAGFSCDGFLTMRSL